MVHKSPPLANHQNPTKGPQSIKQRLAIMQDTPDNVESLSPFKLLGNFSKNRLLRCLFLALLIHAVVIGGFSANYIYRTWIDPGAATSDQEAAESTDAGSAAESPSGGDLSKKTATDGGEASASAKSGSPQGTGKAPIVTRVTGKPEPGEIPENPVGPGITMEDIKE